MHKEELIIAIQEYTKAARHDATIANIFSVIALVISIVALTIRIITVV